MKKGRTLVAAFTMMALVLAPTVAGAFSLTRGEPTPLFAPTETLFLNSVFDQPILVDAFVGAGTLDFGLNIPVNRVQYDILNASVDNITSWTLYYDNSIGPKIIGAATPTGYIDSSGVKHILGGQGYATLFNNGYGLYEYNTGAPWTIDYQPNRIVFTGPAAAAALPNGSACGVTDVGNQLPTFAVLWDRSVPVGYDAAIARADSEREPFAGVVWGPSEEICVSEPAGAIALAFTIPAFWGLALRRRA